MPSRRAICFEFMWAWTRRRHSRSRSVSRSVRLGIGAPRLSGDINHGGGFTETEISTGAAIGACHAGGMKMDEIAMEA